MKKFQLLLFAVLILNISAKAQQTPESLLGQLPVPPTVNCAADRAEIDRFSDRIYQVKTALKEIVDRIHADAQADMEKNKNKIMSNAIKQSGLSKSDVQKLQQSDGSEREGQKAAEKVVSEQYGVSLQELGKVGEMSDAEQEKWANNYASRMKQQAMADPEAAIKKGDKAKRLSKLAEEQKMLGERITERMNRVGGILKEVERQDSIETKRLREKCLPFENQLCSGICSDAEIARSNAAEKQIRALMIQYCEKMSPQGTEAISQYLNTVKSLLPDYRRLTAVQNEIAQLQQIGKIVPEDLYCYAAVDDYATALLNAYKYVYYSR